VSCPSIIQYVSNYFEKVTDGGIKVMLNQHYGLRGLTQFTAGENICSFNFVLPSKVITINSDGLNIFSRNGGYDF